MTARSVRFRFRTAAALIAALSVTHLTSPSLDAQESSTAAQALEKAHVTKRLAESATATHRGTAPDFVLDPAWPKPLPHDWIIGDVGGIFVDRHDHIWVYHRPRSLSSTDSGM